MQARAPRVLGEAGPGAGWEGVTVMAHPARRPRRQDLGCHPGPPSSHLSSGAPKPSLEGEDTALCPLPRLPECTRPGVKNAGEEGVGGLGGCPGAGSSLSASLRLPRGPLARALELLAVQYTLPGSGFPGCEVTLPAHFPGASLCGPSTRSSLPVTLSGTLEGWASWREVSLSQGVTSAASSFPAGRPPCPPSPPPGSDPAPWWPRLSLVAVPRSQATVSRALCVWPCGTSMLSTYMLGTL